MNVKAFTNESGYLSPSGPGILKSWFTYNTPREALMELRQKDVGILETVFAAGFVDSGISTVFDAETDTTEDGGMRAQSSDDCVPPEGSNRKRMRICAGVLTAEDYEETSRIFWNKVKEMDGTCIDLCESENEEDSRIRSAHQREIERHCVLSVQ